MKRHTTRTAELLRRAPLAATAILMVAATFVLVPTQQAGAQQSFTSVRQLYGSWGYAGRMQDGGVLRISFTLAPDGQFACRTAVEGADGQNTDHRNYGYWSVRGNQLIINSDDGPVAHAFELNGGNLRVYLPALKQTLNFIPVPLEKRSS